MLVYLIWIAALLARQFSSMAHFRYANGIADICIEVLRISVSSTRSGKAEEEKNTFKSLNLPKYLALKNFLFSENRSTCSNKCSYLVQAKVLLVDHVLIMSDYEKLRMTTSAHEKSQIATQMITSDHE